MTEQALADTLPGRARTLAVIAAASGNLVEWFDFFTYSYAALYFASSFFPKGDQTTQLLSAAAVFAVGFFVRPLGAWAFGRLADRQGRRKAMVLSVLLMSSGSAMIAVLPTYGTIGRAAAWLLVVARIIQGFSVGGEYGIAATYMSEVATKGRRGFQASFHIVSIVAGQLVALLVLAALQHALSVDQLRSWGWRIPFALGGLGGVVALLLRRSLPETSSATSGTTRKREAGTLGELLRHHGRAVRLVFGFTLCVNVLFFTFTTYMQKYLVNTAGMNAKTASTVMTAALPLYMVMQPVGGALADRFGRKQSMICCTALATLMTVPLFHALGTVTSAYAAFGLVSTALLILSFGTSISGLLKAELFPVEVRALGVTLPHAVVSSVFGGTAEYVALWLKSVGREGLFAWYLTLLAIVGLIAAVRLPDTRRNTYLEPESGS